MGISESSYQDFIKSFKIALTNCSVYFSKHPIFSQSVEGFRKNIKLVAAGKEYVRLGVKPKSVVIDGQVLEDKIIYKELAQALHRRKIKGLSIKSNVEIRELSEFLTYISSPAKDILSKGGIKKILEENKIGNIAIEELDYSYFLKEGEGVEVKDIWNYLFGAGSVKDKTGQYSDFLDNFNETIDGFGTKVLLEDKQLLERLLNICAKLQVEDQKSFNQILKKLISSILKSKGQSLMKGEVKLKSLFLHLRPEDLADVLSGLFQSEASFDQKSFDLISFLIPPKTHQRAAEILGAEYKNTSKRLGLERVRSIFAMLDEKGAVPIYRRYLMPDSEAQVIQGRFHFDQEHLKQNYRMLLLDLFFYQSESKRLGLILKELAAQLEGDFFANLDYLSKIGELYCQKYKDRPDLASLSFQGIWAQAEENIFILTDPNKLDFLLDVLDESVLGEEYYLTKIQAGDFNALVFKLFFKFFPKQAIEVEKILLERRGDLHFLKKALAELEKVNYPVAFDIFKKVYAASSLYVKAQMLNFFKKPVTGDYDFWIKIIKNSNFQLRRKGVELAAGSPPLSKKAAESLLYRPIFFGFNSKIILENLNILSEVYNLEALPFIERLSSLKFFWNRKVREKAKSVLEVYSAK